MKNERAGLRVKLLGASSPARDRRTRDVADAHGAGAAERPARPIAEGRAVALAPAVVDVDVVRFATLAETETREDLAEAAHIYPGDFLEGFVLRLFGDGRAGARRPRGRHLRHRRWMTAIEYEPPSMRTRGR